VRNDPAKSGRKATPRLHRALGGGGRLEGLESEGGDSRKKKRCEQTNSTTRDKWQMFTPKRQPVVINLRRKKGSHRISEEKLVKTGLKCQTDAILRKKRGR